MLFAVKPNNHAFIYILELFPLFKIFFILAYVLNCENHLAKCINRSSSCVSTVLGSKKRVDVLKLKDAVTHAFFFMISSRNSD